MLRSICDLELHVFNDCVLPSEISGSRTISMALCKLTQPARCLNQGSIYGYNSKLCSLLRLYCVQSNFCKILVFWKVLFFLYTELRKTLCMFRLAGTLMFIFETKVAES